MRKPYILLCVLLLALCLTACGGGKTAEPSASPTPAPSTPASQPAETETAYDGPTDPLTGLPTDQDLSMERPYAIMLNNIKAALPQQSNSQADIIYEVLAEGGITRMLAVYQSLDGVGTVGSIRSSRPYYIELALGHDAIYVHAGGSAEAYSDIRSWGVTSVDGVNGSYSYKGADVFWRDKHRIEGKSFGYEHSLVTSGEKILAAMEKNGVRTTHETGYLYHMSFAENGTPAKGETANTITVPFSNYKTGTFTYDAASGLYLAEEYGAPYIDGNTGGQIGVTNVLILKTSCYSSGDSYGHMVVDLDGGDGYFACGGKIVPITWSKGGRDNQLTYYAADGSELVLGQGKSYVNIIPNANTVTYQ